MAESFQLQLPIFHEDKKMVRPDILSLRKRTISYVSERTWRFMMEHRNSCNLCSTFQPEECSRILQPVKKLLSALPKTLIESVFTELRDKFQLHRAPRNHGKTNLLYMIMSLSVELGCADMNIKTFLFLKREDQLFLSKFGTHINSLHFSDYSFIRPLEAEPISLLQWTIILSSASNIRILDISGVEYTEYYLQVIGEQCNHLQVLRGIILAPREITNPRRIITANSFLKLFLQRNESGTVPKSCCETLETINLMTSRMIDDIYAATLNNILQVFVRNLPNLKTVGENFLFDRYLTSTEEIPETNIEVINIQKLTNRLIPKLQAFCPKVKMINLFDSELGVLQKLSLFQRLSKLRVHRDYLAQEILNTEWPTLKELEITAIVNVDIDDVILKFPSLTVFNAVTSNIVWSGSTRFNRLETAILTNIQNSDIFWLGSFSRTIKSITIRPRDGVYFTAESCQVLLTVPFPNLECLSIYYLQYDFTFYINIFTNLPKLRFCDTLRRGQGSQGGNILRDLVQFLKENNLKCELK